MVICDSKEPERIAEALKLVAILVRGDKVEMAKYPLSGKGHTDADYYRALQATAAHENMYWMVVAREQWLELAIEKWGAWVEANRSKLHEIVDFENQVLSDEVDGAWYGYMKQYLNPGWVLESHKLTDQFLAVLLKFPHGEGTFNRKSIVNFLKQRTGCSREHDPHRNELAFKLLLKHYGLD